MILSEFSFSETGSRCLLNGPDYTSISTQNEMAVDFQKTRSLRASARQQMGGFWHGQQENNLKIWRSGNPF